MSVSYSSKVSTTSLGTFLKLLLAWRGSVYKLVWSEYLIYLSLYYAISIVYRHGMSEDQMRVFEQVSTFCEEHSSLIPLTFVLAFYVSHVVSRWWAQWNAIPWPDSLAMVVNTYCPGTDDKSRLYRRTLMRYACLSICDTLRMVSSKVMKRFPTYEHMVDAGLMTTKEMACVRNGQSRTDFLTYLYWVPLTWGSTLTLKGYNDGLISRPRFVTEITAELKELRTRCGTVISYDWISLPLVYTQVVTLALYVYFAASLLGRQWLDPARDIPGYKANGYDYYFPIFTSLQFLFYVGWLKVAEALLNPFGEDDEDFDTNFMIDRNLQISYMMVDELGQYPPPPEKDIHWEMVVPAELPYTIAAAPFRGEHAEASAESLKVPIELQKPEGLSHRHSSYFALNTLMVNVGKWATDTHHATTRLRRTSRAYSTMSTPLPAAAADAPGSLTALDLEGNRKASVKSAKPDLLSFRPKPGSPTAAAAEAEEESCSKAAPSGGEGVNKGASRKASVATNLKAVEEVVEEQGRGERGGNIAIVVTGAEEEDEIVGDRN